MIWRPIETAPKDGTWILCYQDTPPSDAGSVVYNTMAIAHFSDGRWWESGTEPWGVYPILWTHLPDRPEMLLVHKMDLLLEKMNENR